MSGIGGSLFAAFAFSGASYIFRLLDKGGYSAEMHRHNIAMENLSKAREAWYEEEIRKKDEIARKRQELLASLEDMSSVNKALDSLRKISITLHEDNGTKRKFTRRPELSDFYQPSTEMIHYQNFTMGVVRLASGLAIGFLVLTFKFVMSRALRIINLFLKNSR